MTDDPPWHDLTEAARLTGLDREAIRSKARRGHLSSRKSNSGATLVQIPPDMLTGPNHGSASSDYGLTNPLTATLTATQAALADVLAELADVDHLMETLDVIARTHLPDKAA